MALIGRGALDDFSAVPRAAAIASRPGLAGLRRLGTLTEACRALPLLPLDFEPSRERRGLALAELQLRPGFLGDLFGATSEVYFVAWAWDMSGAPPVDYPGAGASPDTCIVPLEAGGVRRFLGAGAVLFPARVVSAGLAVRIMLWESDAAMRSFGRAMVEVADAIQASELTRLLSMISPATGGTVAMVAAVATAATELSRVIGAILRANGDDYVDLYEGYYPVSEPWVPGEERHGGHDSEIVLRRFV
jgi:hypothetical protein